jgi:hypothetical protein
MRRTVQRAIAACSFFAVAFLAGPARATTQYPDVLVIDGEERSLLTNPLEPYFDANPTRRPAPDVWSSALWRRYVATWRLDGDRLVLTKVEVLQPRDDPWTASWDIEFHDIFDTLFPGRAELPAEWFTGQLVIPHGDIVEAVDMGYGSTFEAYELLHLERGVVISRVSLDAEGFRRFREAQFAAFVQSPVYAAVATYLVKGSPKSGEHVREFLFHYGVEEYTRRVFPDSP